MLVCYNAINIEINNKIGKSMLGNKKRASEKLVNEDAIMRIRKHLELSKLKCS